MNWQVIEQNFSLLFFVGYAGWLIWYANPKRLKRVGGNNNG